MANPFLSPSQILGIQDTIKRGFETVQALQNPQVIVQFRRMDTDLGKMVDAGEPVHLISLKFGLREVRETTVTVPMTERASDGDLKMWEGDFDLRVGDRFTWQDAVCEVTSVYPPRNGVVVAEVELKQ